MQYGLELPNTDMGGDAQTLAELAVLAEEAGWDGIFLEDYIVHHSASAAPTYDPWVVLAAMALRTKRIRLGTTVTPLPRRRPWKLARETVTLDHLSHGRLILGVGLGDVNDPGFAQVGEVGSVCRAERSGADIANGVGEATDTRKRAKMLDEALDVLVGLWSGQPFSYQGEFYQVREVTFLPLPVQTPRIPIWVGGNWPHQGVIRRAARYDGFCGGKVYGKGESWCMTPAEVQALKASIEGQRSVATPFDIALGGAERSTDWEQERATIKSLAEAGATWWMEWIAPCGLEEVRARIKQGPLRID